MATAKTPVHVTVTGAAGQIGYSLLFRIASGQLLGPDQPVVLRLLEIEPAMQSLNGVVMELDDCAFPLLAGIEATSDLKTAFDGTSWALLVGSIPRKAGMERNDLLTINGGIFGPQGEAIGAHAASDVRVLVVGNPCNTNCLIARAACPGRPRRPLVRHDPPRPEPGGQPVGPEGRRAGGVGHQPGHLGQPLVDAVPGFRERPDRRPAGHRGAWTRGGSRGSSSPPSSSAARQIIEARGSSSAASAANAVVDSVRSIVTPTASGDCASLAVVSHGEYGTPEGLIFGFPVRSDGSGWQVVTGLPHSAFAQERIAVTTSELESERAAVSDLLLGPV